MSINGFNRVKDLSEFNDSFTKWYNEKSKEGYFLIVDAQYQKNLHKPHNDLPFLPEIKRKGKVKRDMANYFDKKNILSITFFRTNE